MIPRDEIIKFMFVTYIILNFKDRCFHTIFVADIFRCPVISEIGFFLMVAFNTRCPFFFKSVETSFCNC